MQRDVCFINLFRSNDMTITIVGFNNLVTLSKLVPELN